MSFVSSNWAAVVQRQQQMDTQRHHTAQPRKKRMLSNPHSNPHTATGLTAATSPSAAVSSSSSPSSSSSSSSSSPPSASRTLLTPTRRVHPVAAHLHPTPPTSHTLSASSPSSSSPPSPTLVLAIDCEMVGVGPGGVRHSLARCSVVNSLGAVLLDRYVQPLEDVVDYRTSVSGIRPHHLHPSSAATFRSVQAEVAALLSQRILVGHGLHGDLQVLMLSHPRAMLRDTSKWKGLCPDRPRGLKALAKEHLGLDIQQGEHDSVVDARTALALYLHFRKMWELDVAQRKRKGGVQRGKERTSQVSAVQRPVGEEYRPEYEHLVRGLYGPPRPLQARGGAAPTYTSEGKVEAYSEQRERGRGGETRGSEEEKEEESKRERRGGGRGRRGGAVVAAAPPPARRSEMHAPLDRSTVNWDQYDDIYLQKELMDEYMLGKGDDQLM